VHGFESKYGNCIDFVYLDIDNAATKNAKDRLGYLAQPNFFLLDKTGKVVWKKTGMLTETELETQLQGVLKP
jgi:predicted transcriptional regulator